MNEYKGLNTICFICNILITEKDIEKGNIPVKVRDIPGYIHRRCRGRLSMGIIETATNAEDLTGEIDNL